MIDLERLAREAGVYITRDYFPDSALDEMSSLQRFAALVAEECAKLCDDGSPLDRRADDFYQGQHAARKDCAADIREAFKRPSAQRE